MQVSPVKWLVVEEDSEKAVAILAQWNDQGAMLAAPFFMVAEVANALHRRVIDQTLSMVLKQAGCWMTCYRPSWH